MSGQFEGKTVVVTAAGGAICGEIASGLAGEGARVAIWDINADAGKARADQIAAQDGEAAAFACDATDEESVGKALEGTIAAFSTVDLLVNGAGGGDKNTTTTPDLEFFDIAPAAIRKAMDLNHITAIVPCQAVGRVFAQKKAGAIVNITSIAGGLPLSRALGYSNGKAAADSFTRWLAVHMATTYAPQIRVNAIAPGFMITEQNRFLLEDAQTGNLTARGETVLQNVPMSRFGKPEEIVGAALWLLSDNASFVTGSIVAVDGGFSAFCGV